METTQDAGAVTPIQTAEAGGTQGTTGAVTPTATAEVQGSAENTTGQETEQGTEENKDKGAHQKTFEERMAEIEAKNEERLAALEAKLVSQPKPLEVLPELDKVAINRDLSQMIADIRALEDAIYADPENTELIDQLSDLEEKKAKLKSDVKTYNQERERQVKEASKQQTEGAELQAQINRTTEFMDILSERDNLPEEVVKAGIVFVKQEMASNKFFREKVKDLMRSRPAEAAEYIYNHCRENMGKKEQQLLEQKEAAKEALPAGKTNNGAIVGNPQIDALRAQAQKTGNPEDIARYTGAVRQARQTTQ